jgi:hypothetical protein
MPSTGRPPGPPGSQLLRMAILPSGRGVVGQPPGKVSDRWKEWPSAGADRRAVHTDSRQTASWTRSDNVFLT